jgi:hypothetical protein
MVSFDVPSKEMGLSEPGKVADKALIYRIGDFIKTKGVGN